MVPEQVASQSNSTVPILPAVVDERLTSIFPNVKLPLPVKVVVQSLVKVFPVLCMLSSVAVRLALRFTVMLPAQANLVNVFASAIVRLPLDVGAYSKSEIALPPPVNEAVAPVIMIFAAALVSSVPALLKSPFTVSVSFIISFPPLSIVTSPFTVNGPVIVTVSPLFTVRFEIETEPDPLFMMEELPLRVTLPKLLSSSPLQVMLPFSIEIVPVLVTAPLAIRLPAPVSSIVPSLINVFTVKSDEPLILEVPSMEAVSKTIKSLSNVIVAP